MSPHHIYGLPPDRVTAPAYPLAPDTPAEISADLARAIQWHAAASRRADATLVGLDSDKEVDAAAEAEAAAMDSLDAALAALASPDDVAAVLAHAADQTDRAFEPGAQAAVLLRLVAALARRAFGGPAAA